MPDAFVRYRSGGGYQKVSAYDYVFDSRKYLENGTYRDSGFMPMVLPEESAALTGTQLTNALIGTGSTNQYAGGTSAELLVSSPSTITGLKTKQPDEVSHTAPRQLSYYDTTLTFCADSDVSATFAAADSAPTAGTLVLTVADTSLFSGKNVTLTGADLPNTTFVGQLYIAVATSATTLVLQTADGSAYVPWGDAGTAPRTISVVDKIAEFPWRDIMGWSNTEPTR
jgi:hypothetical protein